MQFNLLIRCYAKKKNTVIMKLQCGQLTLIEFESSVIYYKTTLKFAFCLFT